jgi:hypothetical protein
MPFHSLSEGLAVTFCAMVFAAVPMIWLADFRRRRRMTPEERRAEDEAIKDDGCW